MFLIFKIFKTDSIGDVSVRHVFDYPKTCITLIDHTNELVRIIAHLPNGTCISGFIRGEICDILKDLNQAVTSGNQISLQSTLHDADQNNFEANSIDQSLETSLRHQRLKDLLSQCRKAN